jgi:hypothetical protein
MRTVWLWHQKHCCKPNRYIFMTSSHCMSTKNTAYSNAVASCACEFILLLPALFRLVTAVRTFDSRLVTSWTPRKWQPVASYLQSKTDLCIWQALYVFSTWLAHRYGTHPCCQGNSRSQKSRTVYNLHLLFMVKSVFLLERDIIIFLLSLEAMKAYRMHVTPHVPTWH